MKKIVSRVAIFLTVIALTASYTVKASSRSKTSEKKVRVVCNHFGFVQRPRRNSRFASVVEAQAAVDRILRFAGLTRNFVIEESEDVDNAKAGIDGNNKRYIYYNPEFIKRIIERSQTDWAAVGIMAHEIGHHLQGHTLEEEGRNPQEEERIHHKQELEADHYSGFILRHMGASLAQAQAAINAHGAGGASTTHPQSALRLDAIRAGWQQADEIFKGSVAGAGGPTTRQSPPRTITQPIQRAFRVSTNNNSRRVAEGWWAWTVFVDAPSEMLEQISCVEYRLHSTFSPNMYRVCDRGTDMAFGLKGNGWGMFKIQIRVFTKDNRQYDLSHDLRFN